MCSQSLPRGVLSQLKGDWDYYALVLGLNLWRSLQPCWFCNSTPEMLSSPEDGDLLSHKEFLGRAKALKQDLCPLIRIPGLDVTKNVCPDYMHTVDLGVGQDVVGGVFWEAVVQPGLFESGTLDGRMKELWNMIQSFYKHNPPQSRLEGPGGWTFKQKIRPTATDVPSLKCKAAQCRGVQDFVPDLAGVLHAVRDTPHTQRVKELASHFVALKQHLSVEYDLPAAKVSLREFLKVYRLLEEEGEADCVWKMRPKCHLLFHLVEQACPHHGAVYNFWNYAEESVAGKFGKMAKSQGGKFRKSRVARDLFLGVYYLQEFYP